VQAIVIHAPRDLRIEDRTPETPGPGQVKIRIRAGGICGSDLHYYQHGGFGAVRLREPMILGHEVAGEVEALGEGVQHLRVGDAVAVNPSRPCGRCRFCLAGQPNQCLDMRFYGSAMRMPHVQGAFRESLVCDEAQAVVVPPGLSFGQAALCEPLAVCLHAVRQAGSVLGARVLVSGSGPIGALCVLAARHAGAREVVATDLVDAPLALVRRLGADRAVNLREDPAALDGDMADKGRFDAVFECSGSGAGLTTAIGVARPGAVIVQVGVGGEVGIPLSTVVAKELVVKGTFRFHEEFGWAAAAIASGAIDVRPLITDTLPLAEAVRAFELAGDRSQSMKVQLAF
jgi:L-idonate 5-dehydrogenase